MTFPQQFNWPPTGVPIYNTLSNFPSATVAGSLAVAADSGDLYEWNGSAWQQIGGPGAALSLGPFGSSPNANGATLVGGVLNLQPADGTNPGGLSILAQSIAGVKTFLSAPNLSSLTASTALALDGSKNIVSVTNTGTGNNVLQTSPTLITPILGVASATSIALNNSAAQIYVGSALGANGKVSVGGTDSACTGTSSNAFEAGHTSNSNNTSNVGALLSSFTTAASTTVALAYAVKANSVTVGASGTITRYADVVALAGALHRATNSGALVDNTSWSGNYFVNQAGSDPSTFGGQIQSTVTTGTAPFSIASTTLVPNLYVARAVLADSATVGGNLTGPITSVGNATSIASQTGTGTKFVVDTSPTLVTPILGVAAATSIAMNNTSAQLSIGGALSSVAKFSISGTDAALTGTSSRALDINYTGNSSNTAGVAGLQIAVTTAASTAVTLTWGYAAIAPTIGSGGSISRHVDYLVQGAASHRATSNAGISDSATAFAGGNYFLFQNGTDPSSFAGQIQSTVTTGTAPFTVSSTTKVSNLYVDRAALADTVTTNANLTGVITSVGNATSIASQTGTGTKFVVDTSPTLVTPNIGAATATSITSSTGTTASAGVLRLANTDTIAWRNGTNSADLALSVSSGGSGSLQYAGNNLFSSAGALSAATLPAFSGDITTSAGSTTTTAAATQANITSLSNSSGVAVHGTNTNNNASTGFVGEYIEALQSTFTNFPTSNQYGDLGSITLGAGDWEISMIVNYKLNGATATASTWEAGIGTVTGNSATGLTRGVNDLVMDAPASFNAITIPPYRVSISGSTTYFAKVLAVYSLGNPQYAGRISARRPR